MSENQNKAVLTKELLNRKTLEQGLTEEQAVQSKQQYGTNALAKKEAESLWSMFIGAFNVSGSRFSALHWYLRSFWRFLE